MGRQVRGFSAAAADLLLRHPWPGNIRELKNVVRRAALLATGDLVESGHVNFIARGDEAVRGELPASSLKEAVHEFEKKIIRQALEKTGGNKSRVAELLRMSYPTLLSKVKEYGLGE
jgi:DNA-binding NtrC family response regulator